MCGSMCAHSCPRTSSGTASMCSASAMCVIAQPTKNAAAPYWAARISPLVRSASRASFGTTYKPMKP